VNLAVTLIAIDVGIFALANSSLVNQVQRKAIFVKRRLLETRHEISKLTEEGEPEEAIEKIQKKINEYKKQNKEIEKTLFCLTLKGAVLWPNFFFIAALITYILKNNIDTIFTNLNIEFDFFFVFSGLMIIGIYRIYLTLKAIEYTSENVPLPDFQVEFGNGENKISLVKEKESEIEFRIANTGFLIGEVIDLNIFFPDGMEVKEEDWFILEKQTEMSFHPFHTSVWIELDYLHIDTASGHYISITPNLSVGEYKIPIYVNEKSITQKEFELTIEIIEK